jgi:hypothetical protein
MVFEVVLVFGGEIGAFEIEPRKHQEHDGLLLASNAFGPPAGARAIN